MCKIFIRSGSMEKFYLKQRIHRAERESEEQDRYCKGRRLYRKRSGNLGDNKILDDNGWT